MSLELDHIFCLVEHLDEAAARLERRGWVLDRGSVHAGQGTRNRRLAWPEQYLELLWIADRVEARTNPLRLDRRSDWLSTGASPFGLALRGELPDEYRDDFWLYEELGPRIWIHRDNERAPERPLVFVLETGEEDMERRKPRSRAPELLGACPRVLREVRVRGVSPARVLPHAGPPIIHSHGPPCLELVVGPGAVESITEILAVRG